MKKGVVFGIVLGVVILWGAIKAHDFQIAVVTAHTAQIDKY